MSNIKKIVAAGVIGALYATLTLVLQPFSFGPVQLRLSEALCVLPFLYPFTAWGLFAGCLVSNIVGGFGLPDIIFGSLATLAAGLVTARIRVKWLAPLPPVVVNALVIGGVLAFALAPENPSAAYLLFAAEVGAGQLAACYAVGLPLLLCVERLIKKSALPSGR